LIEKYSQSYIRGLQEVSGGKINGALGTNKHFLGDGSTLYGCNMGNTNVLNFKNYVSRNSRGYVGGVKENVGAVMISYSSINWVPSSINSHFLLSVLREDIGFNGFTISDFDDLELATDNLLMPRTFMNFTAEEDAYAAMVNAGVDMFMLSKKAAA
jgi:beta-glucosidase-like glycosyl hydrolase